MVVIILWAAYKRVPMYEAFVTGAKEGFSIAVIRLPLRINFTTGAFFSECSCWKMVGRI